MELGGSAAMGEVLEGYPAGRLEHYRFCRCFSVAWPEGKLGDASRLSAIRSTSQDSTSATKGASSSGCPGTNRIQGSESEATGLRGINQGTP